MSQYDIEPPPAGTETASPEQGTLPVTPRSSAGNAALLLGATAGLCACGGGGAAVTDDDGRNPSPAPPPAGPPPEGANPNPAILAEQRDELAALPAEENLPAGAVPKRMPERSAVRFLAHASFGARPADIEPLRDLWRTGWLARQFDMPVSKSHWDNVLRIQSEGGLAIEASWDASVWELYLNSPDQLRRRAGYALGQIFVVSVKSLMSGGASRALMAAAFADVLEAGAFGNFRDLLTEVTLSPAMGYFLSSHGNRKAEYDATGQPLRMPDENYARELMQLFTIGTLELNPDGTPRLVDGKPVETYQQADVVNLARVFTGWSVLSVRAGDDRNRVPMVHDPRNHSPEEKKFLGTTIAAGTDGPTSLKLALDAIFNHPNVGPFIGRQLIQRLVTSNPSPEYVRRVAARFDDDGEGVRGNMRAVFTQVLLDPEARSPVPIDRPPPSWGKLREPVLRYTQLLRLLDIKSTSNVWNIWDQSDASERLGQSPGRAPSVFNFYEPGYTPPASSVAAAQLVAPEFQIVNQVSVLGIVNCMRGTLGTPPRGTTYNFEPLLALAASPDSLVGRLNTLLAHGTLSPATRSAITDAISRIPGTPANALLRVRTALLLVIASPDYLIQK